MSSITPTYTSATPPDTTPPVVSHRQFWDVPPINTLIGRHAKPYPTFASPRHHQPASPQTHWSSPPKYTAALQCLSNEYIHNLTLVNRHTHPTEKSQFLQPFWSTVKAKTINGEEQLHALIDGKKIIITEFTVRRDFNKQTKPKRKDTQVPQPSDPIESVVDEAVYKELDNSLVRAATTTSSLEVEQDSGGGPRCQETIGDTISQTRRVKKLEKKDRLRTHRLKRLYKVGLTARVESFDDEESLGEDASKQGRINAIDADEGITLVSAAGDIVSASIINTVDDITLAQAIEEMKSIKPKKKGIVIQELGESTTKISSQPSSQQSHDNGKGILIEPVKPMKKKDQILLDEETPLNLQAEFDEEERVNLQQQYLHNYLHNNHRTKLNLKKKKRKTCSEEIDKEKKPILP
ncbi:hypothetical protein Tco_0218532 [Tanacetum coccineum]